MARDDLLDTAMMYWLTNAGASSARPYWESFNSPDMGEVTLPTGISLFPNEIMRSSERWARKKFLDLMYFNDVWNRSYTHGIPPHDKERDGAGGPRISIALLCAEPASKDALCIMPPKSKQKIYGLTMPPRTPLSGTPTK